MNTVHRSLVVLLLLALATACGQMGPLVIPEKTPAAGQPPAPAAETPAPAAPEQQPLKPESAPLQVP